MLIRVGGKYPGILQYTEAFIFYRLRVLLMKILKSIWNFNLISIVYNKQESYFFFFSIGIKSVRWGRKMNDGGVLCFVVSDQRVRYQLDTLQMVW